MKGGFQFRLAEGGGMRALIDADDRPIVSLGGIAEGERAVAIRDALDCQPGDILEFARDE